MGVWEDIMADPHVLINVGSNTAVADYLQYMGLSKDRLCKGPVVADIAYVPNPGGCGRSPGYRYVQAVRDRLHAVLRSSTGALQAPNTILVIQ